ncbi:MAG: class I SAM-dependent methyltransferase [Bermanella sp.]
MSLALPSQLLLQQDLVEQTLLINPPQDDLPHHAPKSWTVACLSFAVRHHYQQQNFVLADICSPPSQTFPQVIIYMSKAKSRLALMLDYARASLQEGGVIWLVGENKGGIKSLAKQLKGDFERIDKMTSGKHSAIVCANGPLTSKAYAINQYYSAQQNDLGLSLQALPGVFSQEKLDKGTAVLLKNLPRKVKGRVLDFGCGAGTIGAYVSLHREVEEIELLDDDILAVRSAQHNIEQNKFEFCEAYLSNGFEKIEDRYHWIISNPPFHQGIKTDYNVTENFLKEAKEHLKLSGKLLLVANEFLNYEVILREHFNGVKQIAKENGFKVLQCEGIRRNKTF